MEKLEWINNLFLENLTKFAKKKLLDSLLSYSLDTNYLNAGPDDSLDIPKLGRLEHLLVVFHGIEAGLRTGASLGLLTIEAKPRRSPEPCSVSGTVRGLNLLELRGQWQELCAPRIIFFYNIDPKLIRVINDPVPDSSVI